LNCQIGVKAEDRSSWLFGFLCHSANYEPTLPIGPAIVHSSARLLAIEPSDVLVLASRQIEEGKTVGKGGDNFAP
jgi:hypothetical protein